MYCQVLDYLCVEWGKCVTWYVQCSNGLDVLANMVAVTSINRLSGHRAVWTYFTEEISICVLPER